MPAMVVWGQPWTYNFGTGTPSSYSTNNSASIEFLPQPPTNGGNDRIRVSNNQGGSFNLENSGTGIQKLGSGLRLRIVAPTGGSVNKFSIYDYTAGKSFYTRFTILFGGSDGNNVNSGTWYFFQGDGTTYSDNSGFSGSHVFTGLQFTFGTDGAITSNYRNGASWSSLGSSIVLQGNVYTFEIFGNNTTSSISYTYNGSSNAVAANKQDIWINGTLVGNDLAKAQLSNDVNIDSWMFYGENSTDNVANIFLDDIVYSNSIASSYTTNLNYFSKSSGNLNTASNWTTNNDGTGSVSPSNFTTGYINYNIRNHPSPSIGADWTVSGTNSKIIVGDSTNTCNFSLSYNLSAPNLDISANGSLSIESGKQVTVSGTLSNSGTLTLKSDATGTGSLIHSTSGVSATVERYIVGHNNVSDEGWHLLGSPVETFNISGSSFVPGTNDDLYAWSESTKLWLNYKAGNPTQIVPGTGYLVSYEGTATKSFSGNLNVSNVSISGLSYTPSQGNGWHLLGNPFASALVWNKTGGSWSLTNVAGTAKIWNSSSKSYSDISVDGIIPPAQGFFVQVTSATNSLTIPASARTHSSQVWYKNSDSPMLRLIARPADGSSAQETLIRIEPEATPGNDPYWDSRFLAGYAPQLYSLAEGVKLSTNALPSISEAMEIPLGFQKNQHNNFTLELSDNSLSAVVLLKDLKTGITHNLTQQPVYTFTSAEGDDPLRFKLAFASVGLEPVQQNLVPYAWYAAGMLHFRNVETGSWVEVYAANGQWVMREQFKGDALSLKVAPGVYMVKISGTKKQMVNKVVIY